LLAAEHRFVRAYEPWALTDLEARNPPSLKALLDDLSKAGGEIDPPDITTVSAWVNDAKTNTKPKVM
jgi:hypothetical protein